MKPLNEPQLHGNQKSKSVCENALLGSTGDSPVLPGDSPGGMGVTLQRQSDACFGPASPAIPAGGSPVPPAFRRRSQSSRREFAKLMGCAMLAGAAMAATRPLVSVRKPGATEPREVPKADDIPVGGYRLFRYPTENDPCILVRLADDRYVAYSQSCTHLMCPVHFQAEKQQFVCPCHEGYFSALNGAVLAGPPRRALPSYAVEIRDGQVLISRQKSERV